MEGSGGTLFCTVDCMTEYDDKHAPQAPSDKEPATCTFTLKGDMHIDLEGAPFHFRSRAKAVRP